MPGTFTLGKSYQRALTCCFMKACMVALSTVKLTSRSMWILIAWCLSSTRMDLKIRARHPRQRTFTRAVMDSIVRSMDDYLNYITPQFSRTHINFQRVPTVDTSNPLNAEGIPSLDESLLLSALGNKKCRLPIPWQW